MNLEALSTTTIEITHFEFQKTLRFPKKEVEIYFCFPIVAKCEISLE